jgi:DNA-binding transcriptional ArsR family regulator
MNEIKITEILKALSVGSRIRIIKLISDRRLCVNAIARNSGITQSAVSQHLKVLKNCDLVFPERYGSIVHYQLNKEKINEFLAGLSHLLTDSEK